MGDISRKGRSPLLKGGRVGFKGGLSTSKYESKVEPFEITPLIGPKGGGGKLPVKKHTAYRKEIAGLKKIHHTKTKLLKKQEARKELASKEALAPKYSPYGKQLASQAQHPKSWRRAGKT